MLGLLFVYFFCFSIYVIINCCVVCTLFVLLWFFSQSFICMSRTQPIGLRYFYDTDSDRYVFRSNVGPRTEP
ncbi:unnamed protein product [Tenebrio molitor]|nr:unnamed protein product [Tenebrio molitor]